MRRVAAWVHVAGRVFAPGDPVPDDLADKIRNPAAWAEDSPALEPGMVRVTNHTTQPEPVTTPDTTPDTQTVTRDPQQGAAPPVSSQDAPPETVTSPVTPAVTEPVTERPPVPPRTGTGSGREPWAAYAAACGVSVPEGAKRDEIIRALTVAGMPVTAGEE